MEEKTTTTAEEPQVYKKITHYKTVREAVIDIFQDDYNLKDADKVYRRKMAESKRDAYRWWNDLRKGKVPPEEGSEQQDEPLDFDKLDADDQLYVLTLFLNNVRVANLRKLYNDKILCEDYIQRNTIEEVYYGRLAKWFTPDRGTFDQCFLDHKLYVHVLATRIKLALYKHFYVSSVEELVEKQWKKVTPIFDHCIDLFDLRRIYVDGETLHGRKMSSIYKTRTYSWQAVLIVYINLLLPIWGEEAFSSSNGELAIKNIVDDVDYDGDNSEGDVSNLICYMHRNARVMAFRHIFKVEVLEVSLPYLYLQNILRLAKCDVLLEKIKCGKLENGAELSMIVKDMIDLALNITIPEGKLRYYGNCASSVCEEREKYITKRFFELIQQNGCSKEEAQRLYDYYINEKLELIWANDIPKEKALVTEYLINFCKAHSTCIYAKDAVYMPKTDEALLDDFLKGLDAINVAYSIERELKTRRTDNNSLPENLPMEKYFYRSYEV